MILQGESYEFGTVFQTVAFFLFVIPRLRPGLLSLRSVLSSRQTGNDDFRLLGESNKTLPALSIERFFFGYGLSD